MLNLITQTRFLEHLTFKSVVIIYCHEFLTRNVCNFFRDVIADLPVYKSTNNDFLFDPIYEIFAVQNVERFGVFFWRAIGVHVS